MFNKNIPKRITIIFKTNNSEDKIIIYPRRKFKETFGMKNPTEAILIEYCENILNSFPNIIDYEVKRG